MKLVIEIPDYTYESLRDCEGTITIGESIVITQAIKNGIPLPKGHGTLKDTDKLRLSLEENHDFLIDSWDGFSNMPVKEKARADEITNCIAEIVNAPTIIEADGGEEE